MIDYSVYMLPNPVKPEKGKKAYAKPQMRELMTFSKFVEHVANHNGVFSRGTVRGVIIDMCECLVEMLLEGKKVEMGELGNFWISLSSDGAESIDKFTATNIKAVNIIFTPGSDFENLLNRAEFNVVSSRVAQVALLKAEKAGEKTVDIEAAKAALKNSKAGDKAGDKSGDKSSGTESGGSSTSGERGKTESGGSTGEDADA